VTSQNKTTELCAKLKILYLSHVISLTCLGETNLKLVTVLLPEAYLEGLDELVRANMYPSRSSAIRSSVRDMLKKELWERRGR
jgi:antitoxin ParD1/3/4